MLLTGSTGSLGSYILHQLASSSNADRIYCLNRGEDAEARQKESLKAKGLQTRLSSVKFLRGDLSHPQLGLEADDYQRLMEEVTCVVHSAWDLNFNYPCEKFVNLHISGVRYLLNLCLESKYDAHFLFISTVSAVLGQHIVQDNVISEEVPSDWSSSQTTGYAQSKLVAEKMINKAALQSGLRAIICRVGQVAGPSTDQGIWSKREWIPSLVASSIRLRKLPDSLVSEDLVDWIPVDLVAQIIVEILDGFGPFSRPTDGHHSVAGNPQQLSAATPGGLPENLSFFDRKVTFRAPATNVAETIPNRDSADNAGGQADNATVYKVFNVVNPCTTTWQRLTELIQDSCSTTLELVSFSEWLNTLEMRADDESELDKLPALKVLDFLKSLSHLTPRSNYMLETSQSSRYSPTLATLSSVNGQWVQNWMRQWQFNK